MPRSSKSASSTEIIQDNEGVSSDRIDGCEP
jgi:hypothetical protein